MPNRPNPGETNPPNGDNGPTNPPNGETGSASQPHEPEEVVLRESTTTVEVGSPAALAELHRVEPNGGGGGGGNGSGNAPATLVRLSRSSSLATPDVLLWLAIQQSTDALKFDNYAKWMDSILCSGDPVTTDEALAERITSEHRRLKQRRFLPFTDTDAYRLLKVATEAFVSVNCGVQPPNWSTWLNQNLGPLDQFQIGNDVTPNENESFYKAYLEAINGTSGPLVLPYLAIIRRKLSDVSLSPPGMSDVDPLICDVILREKLVNPCFIELIWCYWHEQGMLVQTMNAVSRRFQNIHGPADQDPLAMLELAPLRPLNNLLWGYLQDEQHRLSVVRRAYEYDHQYGLTLEGKAVPPLHGADTRSKFLESFHNLLHLCLVFYRLDDDTTVVSDAFPVLIALRDLHLLLVEGAHNQFGDLQTTARMEMLMQEWLLARPEFRDVLPTRTMVDYPEPWMDRVEAMKRLQSWGSTNVRHFSDLGRYGEQLLLSVRFGDWNRADRDRAKNWARIWRSAVQSYAYAYNIVTGVDLTADVAQEQGRRMIATQPSVLLRQQLESAKQSAVPALPSPDGAAQSRSVTKSAASFRERRALKTS